MKKCSSCGTEVGDEIKFCPTCGNEIPNTEAVNKMPSQAVATAPIEKPKSNKIPLIILGVLIVVGLAVAGFFLLKKSSSNPENVAYDYCKAIGTYDVDGLLDAMYTGDKRDELKELYNSFLDESEDEDYEYVSCKIKDTETIATDEIKDIEDQLNEAFESNVKVTDAKTVSLTLTMKQDGKEESEDEDLTIIEVDGKWYVQAY